MTIYSGVITNRHLLINAMILGISTTPLIYILSGALFGFSMMFSVISLPPYIIALGVIIKQRITIKKKTSKTIYQVIESLCFIITLIFIFLISNYNLQTTSERIQNTSLFTLISIAVWCLVLHIIRLKRNS